MSTTRVIRYTTTPETASLNEKLVQDVFAQLQTEQPDGLNYTAVRLADGQSFMHIVTFDTDDDPLSRSTAFAAFQAGIGERCMQGPTANDATIVGAYRAPAAKD